MKVCCPLRSRAFFGGPGTEATSPTLVRTFSFLRALVGLRSLLLYTNNTPAPSFVQNNVRTLQGRLRTLPSSVFAELCAEVSKFSKGRCLRRSFPSPASLSAADIIVITCRTNMPRWRFLGAKLLRLLTCLEASHQLTTMTARPGLNVVL